MLFIRDRRSILLNYYAQQVSVMVLKGCLNNMVVHYITEYLKKCLHIHAFSAFYLKSQKLYVSGFSCTTVASFFLITQSTV